MSATTPRIDSTKLDSLLSRGAAERGRREAARPGLSAVPALDPAAAASAPAAGGDHAVGEREPVSLVQAAAPPAAVGQGVSAAVAAPPAPAPLPPMRKLSFHLTEETVFALYAHQSQVRLGGAKPADTTLGWVIDTLLRQALNLPAV